MISVFKKGLLSTLLLGLMACQSSSSSSVAAPTPLKTPLELQSYWLTEQNGEVMKDPQTSGLTLWRGQQLVTIADGSAHESQILRLIVLNAEQYQVQQKLPILVAPAVAQSCFGDYMQGSPDLEALVVDPEDDRVFYTVTEDASRDPLSEACAAQYAGSGSTPFPTLLVRLELNVDETAVTMTHVRPIQFTPEMQIGNFPNDGIEGITFGFGRTLYLALEKDAHYQARIFSVQLNDEFWRSLTFAPVKDEQLRVPAFNDKKPHPINALTWYADDDQAWLIAGARNDNELWFIDPGKKQATRRIKLAFSAETKTDTTDCSAFDLMNNYSIEGMAIAGDVLWLVNDPWKQNYHKNIQCEANRARYEKMAPLLSKIPVNQVLPQN